MLPGLATRGQTCSTVLEVPVEGGAGQSTQRTFWPWQVRRTGLSCYPPEVQLPSSSPVDFFNKGSKYLDAKEAPSPLPESAPGHTTLSTVGRLIDGDQSLGKTAGSVCSDAAGQDTQPGGVGSSHTDPPGLAPGTSHPLGIAVGSVPMAKDSGKGAVAGGTEAPPRESEEEGPS